MTKKEQKQKILEFIKKGTEIGGKEYRPSPFGFDEGTVTGPLCNAWMDEINIFNQRYLKEHPLHNEIHSTHFHKNRASRFSDMMGHLQALVADEEYWQEECVSESIICEKKQENNNMSQGNPMIFISHRTNDTVIAKLLFEFLIKAGIPRSYIFCSSIQGNDVNGKISEEVKSALKKSVINIAILSEDYYKSAYCLNEAGIIWFQDNIDFILIGMPEISTDNMDGFLNSNYRLRRLDNDGDISYIYETICKAVSVSSAGLSVITEEMQKLKEGYEIALRERTLTSTKDTIQICDLTSVTEDEAIVLYYILSKQVRKITKQEVKVWLRNEEIYDVNIDNAFDLSSTMGQGTFDGENLELDINVFRELFSKKDEYKNKFSFVVEAHRSLSRDRFFEMWNNNVFKDEDKLFIAYIIEERIFSFGERWLADQQIEHIRKWECTNYLSDILSKSYGACLSLFVENCLVYESEWTSYGNPRKYSLCTSLKKELLENNFIDSDELDKVKEKYFMELPF